MNQGSLLKKLVDAMKELVNEANFECSATSFALQAMDTSHVSLVTMELRKRQTFSLTRSCSSAVGSSMVVRSPVSRPSHTA